MYSVSALFDNYDQASKACAEVLDSTNGIVRINTVRTDSSDLSAAARAALSSQTLADSISRAVMPGAGLMLESSPAPDTMRAAALSEAEYDRRAGYIPTRPDEYSLCAHGGREAVEHAARLLRSLGARGVNISDE